MKKTQNNLILLCMIFVVSLVIANVITSKVIQTYIPLFGSTITLPGAALSYAVTFLMTDVIGELYGRKAANKAVRYGFICQIFASLLILLTQYLPAADNEMQAAYDKLLGQNIVFVVGSLIAYLASQHWDVWVFHAIRNKYINKHGSTRGGRWIWNNLSTMSSQIIDTVLFIGIAFGIGMGWLFDIEKWPTLGAMMIGQYLIKFIIALCDTPFFYWLTGKNSFTEGGRYED